MKKNKAQNWFTRVCLLNFLVLFVHWCKVRETLAWVLRHIFTYSRSVCNHVCFFFLLFTGLPERRKCSQDDLRARRGEKFKTFLFQREMRWFKFCYKVQNVFEVTRWHVIGQVQLKEKIRSKVELAFWAR